MYHQKQINAIFQQLNNKCSQGVCFAPIVFMPSINDKLTANEVNSGIKKMYIVVIILYVFDSPAHN